MRCRRCGIRDLGIHEMDEGEEDQTSNPSVIVTFRCYNCNLEYNAVYHITQLLCGTIEEGGGEFPLNYNEGKKMFQDA